MFEALRSVEGFRAEVKSAARARRRSRLRLVLLVDLLESQVLVVMFRGWVCYVVFLVVQDP